MNRVYFILIIFTVTVNNNQTVHMKKVKRQTAVEDRWSWGYFPETTPPNKNEIQSTPTSIAIDYNKHLKIQTSTVAPDRNEPVECRSEYKPPTKPDYRKPGRRISEAKCYEYIWALNNRVQTTNRQYRCEQYYQSLLTQHLPGGPGALGGNPTGPGEFPHMGAVGWKASIGTWVFKCGSSLISEKFVLTAGHCTSASVKDTTISDPVPKIIRLGDKSITDFEQFPFSLNTFKDVKISRIIVHPQYKPPKKYYDIALMELQYAVEFSKLMQPACLWNKFITNGQATATGWGIVESGSRDISPELQVVIFDILDSAQCDALLKHNRNRNWNGMQDHQLCALNLTGGVDACQGDSGGPLQFKIPLPKNVTDQEGSLHYVVGVISFGVGCALSNRPGIYTRVSSFIDWIENHVWQNQ